MKRGTRTLLVCAFVALGIVVPGVVIAGPSCFNFLNRQTYGNDTNGNGGKFATSDLCTVGPCGATPNSTTNVTVNGGGQLQLNEPTNHNVNQIVMPFDQDVYLRYIGQNATLIDYYSNLAQRSTDTLAWFYYDTTSTGIGAFLDGSGNLYDHDAPPDGVADLWQAKMLPSRPNNGLYSELDTNPFPGAADLSNDWNNRQFVDHLTSGTQWPRFAWLIQQLRTNSGGDIIWEMADDDADLATYTSYYWNGQMPMQGDHSGNVNGAPDYDVNGDGNVDNDQYTAMGQVTGSKEIVYNVHAYGAVTSQAETYGLPYSTDWTNSNDPNNQLLYSETKQTVVCTSVNCNETQGACPTNGGNAGTCGNQYPNGCTYNCYNAANCNYHCDTCTNWCCPPGRYNWCCGNFSECGCNSWSPYQCGVWGCTGYYWGCTGYSWGCTGYYWGCTGYYWGCTSSNFYGWCNGYGNICGGYGNICGGYGNVCSGYGNICGGYGYLPTWEPNCWGCLWYYWGCTSTNFFGWCTGYGNICGQYGNIGWGFCSECAACSGYNWCCGNFPECGLQCGNFPECGTYQCNCRWDTCETCDTVCTYYSNTYQAADGGGWFLGNQWQSEHDKMVPYSAVLMAQWPVGWQGASYNSEITNYFSKQMLNSDRGQESGLAVPWSINIGVGYPNHPGGTVQGWLTGQQNSVLSSMGISLPSEVHSFGLVTGPPNDVVRLASGYYANGTLADGGEFLNPNNGANGLQTYAPHFFLGAPLSGANSHLWLMGVEDWGLANAWCTATNSNAFFSCKYPADYNNLVFWQQSEDGGSAVSKDVSSDCAAYPNSCITSANLITKVKFQNFAPTFSGCNASDLSQLLDRADLYYSIDNGATWHLVNFPAGQNTVVIDTLSQGYSGYQLRWKVNMVTAQTDSNCQIIVPPFNVGYEAIQTTPLVGSPSQLYQYTENLPLANIEVRTQYEPFPTVNAQNVPVTDPTPRGHVIMYRVYDPDSNPPNLQDNPMKLLWDAGVTMNGQSAMSRNIYFYNPDSNARQTLAAEVTGGASGDWLWQQLNPWFVGLDIQDTNGVNRHCIKVDGKCVYDFTNDNNLDWTDAKMVARWTQGLDLSGAQRAWLLGGIYHSSGAIIGPPPRSQDVWWYGGSSQPGIENSGATDYKLYAETTYANRPTRVVVGASDGLIHAFQAGDYVYGTGGYHGEFAKVSGQRLACSGCSYGDGSEVWAWAPRSQIPRLRNNMIKLWGYKAAQFPRATMDGSLSAYDAFVNGGWKTIVLAGDGETWPQVTPTNGGPPAPYVGWGTYPSANAQWQRRARYITAVDATDATTPNWLWANDWTDVDFWGAANGPAVAPTNMPGGRKWVAAVSSGIAPSTTPAPLYVYVLDLGAGTTLNKVRIGGNNVIGSYGPVVPIDSSSGNGIIGKGMVDRIYLTDTSGGVWKVLTPAMTACKIGQTSEGIFAPIAVTNTAGQSVSIYVATGSDPTVLTNPSGVTYHFYQFEDNDGLGACNPATVVFDVALPGNQHVWTTPVVSGTGIYLTTSGEWSLDVAGGAPDSSSNGHACSSLGGELLGFDNGGNQVLAQVITGDAVGSLRAYDGHLFISTLTGTASLWGGSSWNGTPPPGQGGQLGGLQLPVTYWSEP